MPLPVGTSGSSWLAVLLLLLGQLLECGARGGVSGVATGEVVDSDESEAAQPAEGEGAGWKGLILPFIFVVGGFAFYIMKQKARAAELAAKNMEREAAADSTDQTRFKNPLSEEYDEGGGADMVDHSKKRTTPMDDE